MDSIYDAQGLSLDNIQLKMKHKFLDVTLDNTRIVGRLCDLVVYFRWSFQMSFYVYVQ